MIHTITELVPYPELGPEEIGRAMYFFVRSDKSSLLEQGLVQMVRRNSELDDAVASARRSRAAHEAGKHSSYLVRELAEARPARYIGAATIIPDLELLEPVARPLGQLPNALLKLLDLQKPAPIGEGAANLSVFLSSAENRTPQVGAQVVERLKEEVVDTYASRLAWTLVQPLSAAHGWFEDEGFEFSGMNRYDQHEGVRWRLPPMVLLTKRFNGHDSA
jgi:hypothetical protein